MIRSVASTKRSLAVEGRCVRRVFTCDEIRGTAGGEEQEEGGRRQRENGNEGDEERLERPLMKMILKNNARIKDPEYCVDNLIHC